MNEIAVLTPIHRRPDLILDQLENYFKFHGENAFHILHPSKEGRPNVIGLDSQLIEISKNIYINPKSVTTSWKCVFAAFLANTNFLIKDLKLKPQYVYLHTDADLLIKGSLSTYIFNTKLAYTANNMGPNWHWFKSMSNDPRFKNLRTKLAISESEVVGGRVEGSFIPIEIWLEIIEIIGQFYDAEYFDAPSLHWPIEEVLVQTLLKKLYPDMPHGKIVVHTRPMKNVNVVNARDVDDNCVQLNEVKEKIKDASNTCMGMKWFSQNYNDSAREFVRSLSPA